MSQAKKAMRQKFRDTVFKRDNYQCRICGKKDKPLDAHHIIDRNLIANFGYCKENGISLCPSCHEASEIFHSTGTALEGFAPDDLFAMIGSSEELARKKAMELK